MGLNIKNEETERSARQLAAATGESLTKAISVAVSERLSRLHGHDDAGAAERISRLRAVAADAANRWIEPYRSSDHGDLLYDDAGLPR